MIQPRSMLDVADNSGAKKVQCIRVMGGANKRYASLGDTVIVADTVAVIAGKERGKRGKVLRVLPVAGRVLVEKLNMMKKHQRPTQKLRQGGIIERESPLALSNVLVVCGRCDKPSRSGIKVLADGRKLRVCKRCGEAIDKG